MALPDDKEPAMEAPEAQAALGGAPGAGKHLRTIGRGASWVFLGEIAKNGFRFLAGVLVGRFLGAAAFCDFCLLMTMERFSQIFADAGLPQANLKFVAQALAHEDEAGARRVSRMTAAMSFLFGMTLFALLWLFAPLIAHLYHRPELLLPIRLAAASIPLASMAWTVLTVAQARKNVFPLVLNQRIAVPLLSLIGTAAVVYWRGGLADLMWVWVLANAVGFVWALAAMAKWLKDGQHEVKEGLGLRELLRYSVATCLGALGRLCLNVADVLILAYYVPQEQLGAYVAASRTAIFILLPMNCINPLLAPIASDLFTRKDIPGLGETYRVTTRWITGAALAISAPMFIAPLYVMRIFGEGFSSGTAVLLAIAAGQFINAATGCVAFLMIMTGGQAVVVWMNAVAVVIMVGSLIAAASFWGIMGAAIAVGAVVAAVNIAQVWWLWRRLGIQPYDARYGICLLLSVGALAAAVLLAQAGGIHLILALVMFYALLAVISRYGWATGVGVVLARRRSLAGTASDDPEQGAAG